MTKAPYGAAYIWCNSNLFCPNELAAYLKRTDLRIVSPAWLDSLQCRGLSLTGIVLDHATVLTDSQWRSFITLERRLPKARKSA